MRTLRLPRIVVWALAATLLPALPATAQQPPRAAVVGGGTGVPDDTAGETATVSPTPADTLPSSLGDEIRSLVAAHWHLGADDVVLDARFVPPDLAPGAPEAGDPESAGDAGRVALLGSGSGGYWVVRAPRVQGPPCSFQVRAGVRTTEMVAARRLDRGQAVTYADMAPRRTVRWGEPSPPLDSVEVGWVAQRVVRAGEPLVRPTVRPPLAVLSGRPVALLWHSGAVELRVQGTASGSAPVGEEVFVRTEEGTRLRGVVVAKGVVDVTTRNPVAGIAGGDDR